MIKAMQKKKCRISVNFGYILIIAALTPLIWFNGILFGLILSLVTKGASLEPSAWCLLFASGGIIFYGIKLDAFLIKEISKNEKRSRKIKTEGE